jgi:hypothetical protein
MSTSYSSLCDDFYLDMYVNTELDLPSERQPLLDFFERLQKQFPLMGNFYRRERGQFCLEEDRRSGQYRWVTVEADRIGSGYVNPPGFEEAYEQDRLILELMPYMLGVNHLDIDSLDVTFGMDFMCHGNHDEVIAEALFDTSVFGCLLDLPNSKAIGFSPTVLTAISEDCRTQARISVESKTSFYDVSNESYNSDEPISVYFTIRQYPAPNEKFNALKSFKKQCELAEELMASRILPNIVRPLTSAIAQRR